MADARTCEIGATITSFITGSWYDVWHSNIYVIPSFHLVTQGLYEVFPSDSISGSVLDLVPGLSYDFCFL
jgi:hypothetical protein